MDGKQYPEEPAADQLKIPVTKSSRAPSELSDSTLAFPALQDTTPPQAAETKGESDLEKAEAPAEPEKPPRDIDGFKWYFAVLSVLISAFLFALDNTIVADIQPAIVDRFGEVSKLSWLPVAFLIAAVGTNLFWGKLYGQFDAKVLYLLNVFMFEAGSAICGAANSMDLLIFGRALCGLGGVGLYAGVMTLLAVTTTEHERPVYIGLSGVMWGLGTVLGPIIGGAFTSSSAGWRWGFYINLVVGAACVPAWLWLLPRAVPRPGVPISKKLAEIDFIGTLLMLGAMVSGVMAINFGGTTYPWDSGRIIGLFVCSGVLFILFGIQQGLTLFTTSERRLFPVEFLKRRTMVLMFICTAGGSTAIFTPIYFIPLYFQFARDASAISAGVHLLPYVVVLVIFCVSNGGVMSTTGWYYPWFFFGGIFTIIGSALLYTIDENSSEARVYGYSVLAAVGGGSFVQAGFSVAQAKVGALKIPEAIGFITLAQLVGATLALAIADAVFLNEATRGIQHILPHVPRGEIVGAVSGAGSQLLKTLDPATRESVIHQIVKGMSKAYILGITAGAVVLVASVAMRREKLFLKAGVAG